MEKFELKVIGLTCATAVAALAAVIAYFIAFRQHPVGGPEEWGQLGDYLGGVINPVVGIVTVVLVIMTLRTTRQEAREARAQIAEQLAYMDRQSVLADMQKRLEGVMAEWERVMARSAPHAFLGKNMELARTIRQVFEDIDLLAYLRRIPEPPPGANRLGDHRFNVFKLDVLPLVYEMDDYCRQYDATAKTRHLTDFYRNRMKQAVEMLSRAGVMTDSVAERFATAGLPDVGSGAKVVDGL